MARRGTRPHRPTTRRNGPGRGRRLALGAAVVASLGLTAVGVAGAVRRQPEPTALERQVQREIAAMIDSGMSEDDPKVRMVEEQLDQIHRSDRADPPPEPGVDLGRRVADAKAGTHDGRAWQSGTVECEPVPQLLTAREVAGATCLGVPQPDGSTRYVAVGPDGVVRTVAFGADGKVGRLPNRQLPGGVAAGATTVAPTAAGDLRITASGQAPVTVDVG
jgi:hypothetical protein